MPASAHGLPENHHVLPATWHARPTAPSGHYGPAFGIAGTPALQEEAPVHIARNFALL
jgi:hypothetical protein